MSPLVGGLATLSQILASGIVITTSSLLLFGLSLNLRERVVRAFAALLAFVTIVYFCDVVVSTLAEARAAEPWLRLQWLGIAFIPVAYLHFSDALLATTGQPSRGRRRTAVRLLYITAGLFLVAAAFSDVLVLDAVLEASSAAAHLRAGPLFLVFLAYFGGSLAWAGWNFLRAYRRCQTSTTRRRMLYLMTSAAAPPLGTFPFLLIAGGTAALHPVFFWALVIITNTAVTVLLLVMAYTVAYFGIAQPDRIVKARFFQWVLRGPLVASSVLAVYVLVTRYGPRLPVYDQRLLPFLLVGVLLVLQFVITLVRLPIERALFYGADRRELRRLQVLEERLLTSQDLSQFFESALAELADALGSPAAFLTALDEAGRVDYEAAVGSADQLRTRGELPPLEALRPVAPDAAAPADLGDLFPYGLFAWGEYWIVPLRTASGEFLGLLGFQRPAGMALSGDAAAGLSRLSTRLTAALEDRRLQQAVFQALDRLLPEIDVLQRLRASGAYAGRQNLTALEPGPRLNDAELPLLIKDALRDFWGGPKLTNSPLLRLRVVERALAAHDGQAANALRAVLREAVERIRPEGQRKFTAEWLLYNILELKFLQGQRVRDVAARLAVSEADLYRKQRVALEELAQSILEMEREAGRETPAERPPELPPTVE
ncbi:MAG: hypothetical protein JNK29_18245 [Anaerolineales bacterium]|nr:hypothetical protein [Anaerolineales bacterium]